MAKNRIEFLRDCDMVRGEEDMAEKKTDYAEGSGSTWESLEGDFRIVPGAEVLVGRHRGVDGVDNWTPEMNEAIGRRATISGVGFDYSVSAVCLVGRLFNWRCRDLVCLRLASGELTEEGRALEYLDGHYDVCSRISGRMLQWLERAGIILYPRASHDLIDFYADRRRLAMALGKEPKSVDQLVDGNMESASAPPWKMVEQPCVEPIPTSPVICPVCKTQPVSLKTGTRGYCSDCMGSIDSIFREMEGSLVENPSQASSGEQHNASLYTWLKKPMGMK